MEMKARFLFICLSIFLFIAPSAQAGDKLERASDVLQVVLPATAYVMIFGFDDKEGRSSYTKALALTVGVTWGLKLTVDKKRPNGGSQAFPSGHTSAAFSGASFIERRYGWELGIPAYVAASFVAFSRVESDNHFVEDVIAGAAIGTISTYLFTKPIEKRLSVVPLVGGGTYGVFIETQF